MLTVGSVVVTYVSFDALWGDGAIFNSVLESVFTDINGCKTHLKSVTMLKLIVPSQLPQSLKTRLIQSSSPGSESQSLDGHLLLWTFSVLCARPLHSLGSENPVSQSVVLMVKMGRW